jgi:hypothetical protein
VIQQFWPCEISSFPCKYLDMPLSLRKLKREQVQPIVDKIANQLPGWKADLLTKVGRSVLVQSVLTGMLIYSATAVDLPSATMKDIDKIRRGFLWRGRKNVMGGHCAVAWGRVCRPRELGGLGIFSITELSCAFKMHWAWLQKSEPGRPWSSMPLHIPKKIREFLQMALYSEIGSGASTLFWGDRWLSGQRIVDIAPRLLETIPKKLINKRTVQEAIGDNLWINDIHVSLFVGALADFLRLWDLVAQVDLYPDKEDKHIFWLAANGKYSAKAAYEGLFLGSVEFEPFELINKSIFFLLLFTERACFRMGKTSFL